MARASLNRVIGEKSLLHSLTPIGQSLNECKRLFYTNLDNWPDMSGSPFSVS